MYSINKQGETKSMYCLYLPIFLWEWCILKHLPPSIAIHVTRHDASSLSGIGDICICFTLFVEESSSQFLVLHMVLSFNCQKPQPTVHDQGFLKLTHLEDPRLRPTDIHKTMLRLLEAQDETPVWCYKIVLIKDTRQNSLLPILVLSFVCNVLFKIRMLLDRAVVPV